jgi:hypothetical protein
VGGWVGGRAGGWVHTPPPTHTQTILVQVLFTAFDALNLLRHKSFTEEEAEQVHEAIAISFAQIELALPTYDLNYIFHQVIEISKTLPPHVAAAWALERNQSTTRSKDKNPYRIESTIIRGCHRHLNATLHNFTHPQHVTVPASAGKGFTYGPNYTFNHLPTPRLAYFETGTAATTLHGSIKPIQKKIGEDKARLLIELTHFYATNEWEGEWERYHALWERYGQRTGHHISNARGFQGVSF